MTANKIQEDPLRQSEDLVSRRQVIIRGARTAVAIAGMGALGKAVFAAYTRTEGDTTPEVTEGPYWVDELLHRSDIRTDPSGTVSGLQAGLPLYLAITVSQLNPTTGIVSPLSSAFVDLWHCNAQGVYSDIQGESTSGQKWLRGYQVTDTHGNARFVTVYPSWYSGRTIHIHARVRLFPSNDTSQTASFNFTTQFFFDDSISDYVISNVSPYKTRLNRDTKNATDSIFTGASFLSSSDGVTSEAGDYLLLHLAEDSSHANGKFHMILDLSDTSGTGGGTAPTGGPGH